MAFAIIPLSMKAYVTATATSGDYTLYALKFVSNNEDEDDIEGVEAIYTAEDLQLPLLSTQQWYGVYFNPIDDGTNYVFKAAYLGDKYTATVAKTDTDTLSGTKPMVFTNDNAESRLLPIVTAEDVGKIVAVNEDGEWELSDIPEEFPNVTTTDNNKGMFVENGEWTLKDAPSIIIPSAPAEILNTLTEYLSLHLTEIITANGAACYYPSITSLTRENAADTEAFDNFVDKVIECCKNKSYPSYDGNILLTYRKYSSDSAYLYGEINYTYYLLAVGGSYNFKFEPIIKVSKNIVGTGPSDQIMYGAVVYYLPQPT